jgi:hypothetical protein
MSLPEITYNSKTISFLEGFDDLNVYYPDAQIAPESASGIGETLGISVGCRVELSSSQMDTGTTLERNLKQFHQWAKSGQAWYLALDAAEKILTTLSLSALQGATALTLTTTSGITAGNLYVVRSKTALDIVKVASVDSGTVITLTEALNFAFASGSRFRSEKYWPGRLVDQEPALISRPPVQYDFVLRFREDVNAL